MVVGVLAATPEEALGESDAAGELLLLAEPDDPPPIPLTGRQVPVKEPESAPDSFIVTSGPGSGKTTSLPSTVVQPLPRFATKMDGRSAKAVDGALLEPLAALMVTLAHDI